MKTSMRLIKNLNDFLFYAEENIEMAADTITDLNYNDFKLLSDRLKKHANKCPNKYALVNDERTILVLDNGNENFEYTVILRYKINRITVKGEESLHEIFRKSL